jgi:hypothetical protein
MVQQLRCKTLSLLTRRKQFGQQVGFIFMSVDKVQLCFQKAHWISKNAKPAGSSLLLHRTLRVFRFIPPGFFFILIMQV